MTMPFGIGMGIAISVDDIPGNGIAGWRLGVVSAGVPGLGIPGGIAGRVV
jgi:hypothetical protein